MLYNITRVCQSMTGACSNLNAVTQRFLGSPKVQGIGIVQSRATFTDCSHCIEQKNSFLILRNSCMYRMDYDYIYLHISPLVTPSLYLYTPFQFHVCLPFFFPFFLLNNPLNLISLIHILMRVGHKHYHKKPTMYKIKISFPQQLSIKNRSLVKGGAWKLPIPLS